MHKGYVRDINYQFVKKNSEIVDVLLSAITEWDEDGNYTRSLAILTDITKQRNAEEELEESEQKYRSLFEDNKDAIVISSIEGVFIDVNQTAVKLLGYKDRNDLIGSDSQRVWAKPERRDILIDRLLSEAALIDYEVKLKRKDGSKIDCMVTTSLQKDALDDVIGIQTIIRDITQQKLAEQVIRESEERFRGIVEDQTELIVRWKPLLKPLPTCAR